MVGMADGFAQASGKTTVVNLHTAPGVGNAMGAIFNAQANHSPLLVTAGQQARAQITLQANLTNRDATRMPHPLVKWSYEPPRAEDVPLALAHGAHLAGLPPRGPVFVSLPMDDWGVEVDAGDAQAAIDRQVDGRAARRPGGGARPRRSGSTPPTNPVLVAGPDIDASRRLGPRHRPRRAPAPAGLGLAGDRRRPARLPRGPSQLPRRAAAGDRAGRADARGPRPDPRRRQLGLPLLPVHPRAAAARGGEAGGDHQRPRRGGAGADGRRDRRRRQAHPGGAAGGGAGVAPPGAGAEPAARAKSRPTDPLNPSTVHTALGRGPARGRDRRARVALQHPRAAQPAAALAPGQLLLRRRRRPRLRPRRLGRGAAGAARPAGRLRARRGLGPVRDHRLLERRRLQGPGHLPGPAATRSTRSSSGSPKSRG